MRYEKVGPLITNSEDVFVSLRSSGGSGAVRKESVKRACPAPSAKVPVAKRSARVPRNFIQNQVSTGANEISTIRSAPIFSRVWRRTVVSTFSGMRIRALAINNGSPVIGALAHSV